MAWCKVDGSRSRVDQPDAAGGTSCTIPPRVTLVVVGLALALIAAAASYYSLVHGFSSFDTALTSLEFFTAGALIYMGLVFSVVAVANFAYTIFMGCFNPISQYTLDEVRTQVGLSLLAPLVALPAALSFGAQVALK